MENVVYNIPLADIDDFYESLGPSSRENMLNTLKRRYDSLGLSQERLIFELWLHSSRLWRYLIHKGMVDIFRFIILFYPTEEKQIAFAKTIRENTGCFIGYENNVLLRPNTLDLVIPRIPSDVLDVEIYMAYISEQHDFDERKIVNGKEVLEDTYAYFGTILCAFADMRYGIKYRPITRMTIRGLLAYADNLRNHVESNFRMRALTLFNEFSHITYNGVTIYTREEDSDYSGEEIDYNDVAEMESTIDIRLMFLRRRSSVELRKHLRQKLREIKERDPPIAGERIGAVVEFLVKNELV